MSNTFKQTAAQTLCIHRHLPGTSCLRQSFRQKQWQTGLTFGQTVQEGSPSAPESASREASSDGLVPSKCVWAQTALPVRKRGLHKVEAVIGRYMGRKRAGTGAANLPVSQHRCSLL